MGNNSSSGQEPKVYVSKSEVQYLRKHTTYSKSEVKQILKRVYRMALVDESKENGTNSQDGNGPTGTTGSILKRQLSEGKLPDTRPRTTSNSQKRRLMPLPATGLFETGVTGEMAPSILLPLDALLQMTPSNNLLSEKILDMFVLRRGDDSQQNGKEKEATENDSSERYIDYLEFIIWMNRFSSGSVTRKSAATSDSVGSSFAVSSSRPIASTPYHAWKTSRSRSSSELLRDTSEGSPVFSHSPLLNASPTQPSSLAQESDEDDPSSSTSSVVSSPASSSSHLNHNYAAALETATLQEEKFKFLFRLYDQDHDDAISRNEMSEIFSTLMQDQKMSTSQLNQIAQKTITEFDLDRDGKLNYREFRSIWRQLEGQREEGQQLSV